MKSTLDMSKLSIVVITVLLSTLISAYSFSLKYNVVSDTRSSESCKLNMINSRRNFLTDGVAFGAVTLFPKEVLASGGATAGKIFSITYLL